MNALKLFWEKTIGCPRHYEFEHQLKLIKKYDFGDFTGELYLQANGPGTFQRVLLALPKKKTSKIPAVAVPFYFPEAMLGFELESRAELTDFEPLPLIPELIRRGYAAVSADAYHLTYLNSDAARADFQRWPNAGTALTKDHPEWTGIGKLTADTKLMLDLLEADSRIDSSRIGITGHSLGGKMAFYTGFLDPRVKAIMASDFGIGWDQTNWNDIWYWGNRVDELKKAGVEHSSLMGADPKPFCLLAGMYDNEDSRAMMQRAPGYETDDPRLVIYNHASGHRPPADVLSKGFDFLDTWLR